MSFHMDVNRHIDTSPRAHNTGNIDATRRGHNTGNKGASTRAYNTGQIDAPPCAIINVIQTHLHMSIIEVI